MSIERFDALSAITGRRLDVTSAIYAGWDGRLVKFGQTVAARGASQRLKAYVTHNPLFRFVAVVEHENPKWIESSLIGLHRDDKAFERPPTGRGDVEWFKPTPLVLATVVALRHYGRAWLDERWSDAKSWRGVPTADVVAAALANESGAADELLRRGEPVTGLSVEDAETIYVATAGRLGEMVA
jgi:hypothetical protein